MLYAGQPHLELQDLRERLRAGDFTRLTLTFREAGSVTLQIQVLNRTWEEEDSTMTAPPGTSAEGVAAAG